MGWLIGRLVRTGVRRGLRDGSRGWLYVGITAAAVGVLRRIFTEAPETVFETELEPGRGIEVRSVRRGDDRGGARTRR
jgi:hypothetical protein